MRPVVAVHPLVPQRQGARLAEVPSVVAQMGADMQMQCKELSLHALVETKFALKTIPLLSMQQPGGFIKFDISLAVVLLKPMILAAATSHDALSPITLLLFTSTHLPVGCFGYPYFRHDPLPRM